MSPLWRPAKAVDGMDKADALPTPPTAEQIQKSGHLMCCINRTTSEARYIIHALSDLVQLGSFALK
jgi:hypothetical protein